MVKKTDVDLRLRYLRAERMEFKIQNSAGFGTLPEMSYMRLAIYTKISLFDQCQNLIYYLAAIIMLSCNFTLEVLPMARHNLSARPRISTLHLDLMSRPPSPLDLSSRPHVSSSPLDLSSHVSGDL